MDTVSPGPSKIDPLLSGCRCKIQPSWNTKRWVSHRVQYNGFVDKETSQGCQLSHWTANSCRKTRFPFPELSTCHGEEGVGCGYLRSETRMLSVCGWVTLHTVLGVATHKLILQHYMRNSHIVNK